MIPEYSDTWYCLILDHNRFHADPLAAVFQNEECPELVRLFDGTILESVAEEGPWCVFFQSESPFLYNHITEQQWESDAYWKAGSSLVIGYPKQSKEEILGWVQSRTVAQSPLGNAMVFRFYSPALLDTLTQQFSSTEKTKLLNGISEIVWANGSLKQQVDITPNVFKKAYQLPEQFYKGLME
ncbi:MULTISPECIES: DUF4123 domain-containing protein [unclassified Neptuniibacter]|uniref:DUF4123 domain-containing protein n=1 Tax=unclassified Neptuniibacter TaxID=2630693 RepID=UPI0025E5EAF0|nr:MULTISPECIES: DUF4123 domain-containing protein [unclassified Neptuniibacter]|tara:strand:- start:40325 stop:40873 length:549 start_codon:yes stop_codon:yes gene_type:complete